MSHLFVAALFLLCPWGAQAAGLTATPVDLLPPQVSAPALPPDALPKLRYAGGLELRADADLDFGGLSGMNFDPAGSVLTAVSDQAHWFRLRLRFDKQFLVGAEQLSAGVLRNELGHRLMGRLGDSEDLTAWRGDWLVSFERRHRILRYESLDKPGTLLAGPAGLAELPVNSGIEAMATLPNDRLLVLTEMGQAWVGVPGAWRELSYDVASGFRPTGAIAFEDRLYVVERRFSLLGGLEARLVRHDLDGIKPGATLKGELLGQLAPPLISDNFEAINVARNTDGSLRLLILSDDNFSPFQRTLLLSFIVSGL